MSGDDEAPADPLEGRRASEDRLAEALCPVKTYRPAGWGQKARELELIRRRFEAGNPLAVHDALVLCRDGELPLPPWLSEALGEFVRAALSDGVKGRRGKGNSFLGDVRKAYIEARRAEMVERIRAVQRDRREWPWLPRPILLLFFAGQIGDFGNTMVDACNLASRAFRGTIAQGEPSTMRRAFLNRGKLESAHMQTAKPETLHSLGICIEGESTNDLVAPEWVLAWEKSGDTKP